MIKGVLRRGETISEEATFGHDKRRRERNRKELIRERKP